LKAVAALLSLLAQWIWMQGQQMPAPARLAPLGYWGCLMLHQPVLLLLLGPHLPHAVAQVCLLLLLLLLLLQQHLQALAPRLAAATATLRMSTVLLVSLQMAALHLLVGLLVMCWASWRALSSWCVSCRC
jgi:hypothetical protein